MQTCERLFRNNEITERRRAEEAAREEKELFALFMRHSPIYAYDKVPCYLTLAPLPYEKSFGY